MNRKMLMKTDIFICAIIIVGFITTSLISYHSNRGIYSQDVEHISTLTSEGIYHQIDSIFTKPINISLTMANDSLLKDFLMEEERRGDDEEFVQTMKNYLLTYREKYDYDSVFLVSAKTNRYYHFDKGVDRVLYKDNPENVWYYAFLESPVEYSLNIDNDEVAAANNEITVFINCKIPDDDGNTMGVVGVGFRVNYLQDIFRQYEEDFGIRAYLLDEEGVIQISTEQTGYEHEKMFSESRYQKFRSQLLSQKEEKQSFWYNMSGYRGYMVSKYVSELKWYLIIDSDTSPMEAQLNRQLLIGIIIISAVIIAVLFVITNIIRKYNTEIIRLTMEKEKEHRSTFQAATEKMYENIYEIDITHNRAASEATEEYFMSLGVPKNTPFDEALTVIAEKQIREDFRQGYIDTFSPENVLASFASGQDSLRYDFLITADNGESYYWMRITTRIFYWDDDQSVRMFVYRQNIDKEKQQERQMVERMQRDSLSRLYNKAATQEYIHRELLKNPRGRYAFFIVDIDDFKSVNDTCGHAAGDIVIAGFAAKLGSRFRQGDIVGRIGGDEFVAFVPIPNVQWAVKKAGELVSVLNHEFVDGEKRCRVSASVGIAISPEDGTDFDTLYKNADAALYNSKYNGKNGYSFYKSCPAGHSVNSDDFNSHDM